MRARLGYDEAFEPMDRFNPDFWQIYTSRYADLAHMTREQAIQHWNEYGRREGRRWNGGVRAFFAKKYLKGDGIEIGALHNPLEVPPEARVKYVDVRASLELNDHYPELGKRRYRIDIVDDGEKLGTIANDSLDFIIGNHFLEHAEDLLGTIESHMKKLRRGGIAYYSVPDMRDSFDKDRAMTTWRDVLADHADGGAGSRAKHYWEWAALVDKVPEKDVAAHAGRLMAKRYSIHFSVADHERWCELFQAVRRHLVEPFTVLEAIENDEPHETIHVLRKN